MQSQRSENVALSAQDGHLGDALKELESLGFPKFKQNLRLLKKTNGNVVAVREFLLAKRNFRDAKKTCKKDHCLNKDNEDRKDRKDGKECRQARRKEERSEKKEKKRELKIQFKGASCRKDWKKHVKAAPAVNSEEGAPIVATEARARRNSDPDVEARILPSLSVWPVQVSRLYLDGNNMLYVAAPLREKAIHGQMSGAGLILSSVAYEFAKILPAGVKTTMVFDAASQHVTQSYRMDNFQILSAKPAFGSSDDALVQWAKENEAAHVLSMVITSDRGLQKRLAAVSGVVIVRPKVWMQYAAAALDKRENHAIGSNNNAEDATGEALVHLDQWMASWIKRMEEASLASMLQTSLSVSDAK